MCASALSCSYPDLADCWLWKENSKKRVRVSLQRKWQRLISTWNINNVYLASNNLTDPIVCVRSVQSQKEKYLHVSCIKRMSHRNALATCEHANIVWVTVACSYLKRTIFFFFCGLIISWNLFFVTRWISQEAKTVMPRRAILYSTSHVCFKWFTSVLMYSKQSRIWTCVQCEKQSSNLFAVATVQRLYLLLPLHLFASHMHRRWDPPLRLREMHQEHFQGT